ncbi:aminotransferase class V-fold PLP-dependent enzyme [Streptomyces sp. R-74717]|uniref:aminotransferase class V-fold PLP-dependent enzyme n=1 Tax=Streptomyces TaxID=1883 RepID=UPI0037B2FA6E
MTGPAAPGFGAVPGPVARAHRRLTAEAVTDPDAFFLGVPDRLAEARARIAAHMRAEPEGTVFVTNATEGANLVLDALRLAPDDEILVTDRGGARRYPPVLESPCSTRSAHPPPGSSQPPGSSPTSPSGE